MSSTVELPTAAAAASPFRRGTPSGILRPALILLAVLVAYWPAIDGKFLWDDDANVTDNGPLRTRDGLRRIWLEPGVTQQYFPVLHTMLWTEYQLWGEDPRGYHLVNLALHACAAVLLARVLVRLNVPGAWLAGAIFALHPVCVESVAWITEGKNTLSLAFFLTSLLLYLRAEGIGPSTSVDARSEGDGSFRIGPYCWSLAAFVAAVLSKTNAVALPAVILVVLAWRNGRLRKRDLLRVVPMFVFGAAIAAIVVYVERVLLGAGDAEFDWPWSERILVAGRAVWFYLGKLLWPYPLTFIYPRWRIDAGDPGQWLFPIAAVALPIVLWKLRRRIGGGPLVAALYFGGTLMPQLGLLPLYGQVFSYVADHWCYLSVPGPIALVAACLTVVVRRALDLPGRSQGDTPGAAPKLGIVGAIILLGVLGVLTRRQSEIYRNQDTLWNDTLAKNPDCWLGLHNLAVLRIDEERYSDAEAGLEKALALRPRFKEAQTNYGLVAEKLGRVDEARRAYERALEIDPHYADAHASLATLLVAQGDFGGAIKHLEAALARKPDLTDARASLGLVLFQAGRAEEAIRTLKTALDRNPADVAALVNLGTVLGRQGKFQEARGYFAAAAAAKPDSAAAYTGLGGVLLALGENGPAVEALSEAIRLDPRQVSAQFNLGSALARLGRHHEAIAAYERAVHVAPEHVPSRLNLAATLLRVGSRRSAEQHLQAVLRLNPNEPNATKMLDRLRQTPASPAATEGEPR